MIATQPKEGENMAAVFVVQHVREDPEGCEDVKFIGAYSTFERAQQSVEDHKELPGFSNYAGGFSIQQYEVDADHWTEGFMDARS